MLKEEELIMTCPLGWGERAVSNSINQPPGLEQSACLMRMSTWKEASVGMKAVSSAVFLKKQIY